MRVIFLPEAAIELVEAADRYEQERAGLGDGFLNEVKAALVGIAAYPQSWRKLSGNVRRARLRRFPYAIVYRARDEAIDIVAVAHLHRRSYYWRGRLR